MHMNTCNYLYSGNFSQIPRCFITQPARRKSLIECPFFYSRARLNLSELRLHSKAYGKVGHLNSPCKSFYMTISFVNMSGTRKKEISELTFISSISSPSTTPPANDSFSGYQDDKNTVKCSLLSYPQHQAVFYLAMENIVAFCVLAIVFSMAL